MKIIVGLGNPGLKYRKTRHNAGFLAVGVLAKKHGIPVKKNGFGGKYGIGRIFGEEIILFEPMTYMNLSGEAVASVCASKLEEKQDLLIVSDDIDLPLGSIRLRKGGSSGGHNGLKSVIEQIGSDFTRLRIGVRSEDALEADAAGYVLGRFPRKQMKVMEEAFKEASECIETWIKSGPVAAMNRFN